MEELMGSRIAQKRKELGLTQNKLAELLIVSNKAVSKWENNLSYPSIDLLPKLADILCCTIDYLIRGSVDDQNNKKYQTLNKKIDEYLSADILTLSCLQRTFKIGFARACRIMYKLEELGYVCRNFDNQFITSPLNKVLAKKVMFQDLKDLQWICNSQDEE